LQRRMLEELIHDDTWGRRSTLQFNNNTRSLRGFITKVTDTVDHLVIDQLCNALNQRLSINVIRNLGYNDLLFTVLELFGVSGATNLNNSAPCAHIFVNAIASKNRAPGREIGSRHKAPQLFNR